MAVFVSYARKDRESDIGLGLLSDLDRMRMPVWIDSALTGGQAWWDEILNQIRLCDVFLPLLSPRWLKSEACTRELTYALQTSRRILPVQLGGVGPWELPESLRSIQIIDYSQRSGTLEEGMACAFALRDALESFTGTAPPALPEPLPQPPEVPASYLSALQPLIHASELSFKEQETFLAEVRSMMLRDEEGDDRDVLLEALRQFRSRPDVAYSVALQVDEVLSNIAPVVAANRDEPVDTKTQTSLPRQVEPRPREAEDRTFTARAHEGRMNVKQTRYTAPGVDVEGLASSLCGWYEAQKLEAQVAKVDGRHVVQARSKGFAQSLGAGAALTVILALDDDELVVEMGRGKWSDKAVAAGIGLLVLWPALVPAAVGGHKQLVLPQKTIRYIESMIPLYSSGSR